MSKYFLKLISIDVLIEFLITYLASTVKNPSSSAAIRLRSVVLKLHMATGQFLDKVS